VLDTEGFRPNVGIVLVNQEGRVLWAKRLGGQDAWQFPQGGIDHDESPEQALFRELMEEVGLSEHHVKVLGGTRGWLRYRLPPKLMRNTKPQCIGQKQKWFLLELIATDDALNLNASQKPEFSSWEWVSYWYPISKVVSFKREVYRRALKELRPFYHQRFNSLNTKAVELMDEVL